MLRTEFWRHAFWNTLRQLFRPTFVKRSVVSWKTGTCFKTLWSLIIALFGLARFTAVRPFCYLISVLFFLLFVRIFFGTRFAIGGFLLNFFTQSSVFIRTTHWLKLHGKFFPSICLRSGVRQGCPLSPLLFALATDSLLRRLLNVLPTELDIVRAFADDIAAVCSDWCKSIPFLSVLFLEFEKVSALNLNIAKTMFIPLWEFRDISNVRKLIQEHCPAWKRVSITHCAKYLGFLVGPTAGSHQWEAPLQKIVARLYKWSALPIGNFLRLKLFKSFSLSTLSFIMQLADLPTNAIDLQRLCVRKLFPGPGNWISLRDAQHLQRKWHFPLELDDFHILSLAIRVRTWRQIGMRCNEAIHELDEVLTMCPFQKWLSASFYRVLWKAVLEVRSRGIDLEGLLSQDSTQWSFQKSLVKALKQKDLNPYCPLLRLQDKFSRWNLSERGSVACHRALRCLQNIAKFSRPAVVAAIHRVWFNGWPTARRMRNLLSCDSVQGCKLGCQHGEDSIEHYSSCRVFWSFCCSPLPRGLGMLPGTSQRKHFSWSTTICAKKTFWNLHMQFTLCRTLWQLQPGYPGLERATSTRTKHWCFLWNMLLLATKLRNKFFSLLAMLLFTTLTHPSSDNLPLPTTAMIESAGFPREKKYVCIYIYVQYIRYYKTQENTKASPCNWSRVKLWWGFFDFGAIAMSQATGYQMLLILWHLAEVMPFLTQIEASETQWGLKSVAGPVQVFGGSMRCGAHECLVDRKLGEFPSAAPRYERALDRLG